MRPFFRILPVLVGFILLGYLFWVGVFHTVRIEEREVGPYTLLYKAQTGDYRQIGEVLEEVLGACKSAGVDAYFGFGIYHDDPSVTPIEELRSEAGVILKETSVALAEEKLKGRFEMREFPKIRAIVSEFPFRNFMSIIVGIYKVYPELEKEREARGFPKGYAMEIYDPGTKILYVMPIPTP